MHSTKKGNQWHFGMKAHIGADDQSGLAHTVISTAANVSDISQTAALLHGEEQRVGADAGYVGVEKRAEVQDKLKASLRAKVEYPFHVVKNLFKHTKTRYKGQAKNDAQLHTLFALSNLYRVRGKLCP